MNNFTENTEEIQKETKPQLYKPGTTGRPKGSLNYTTLLNKALNDYETETGRDLFKRFVERAYTNDRVLIALMKKFIPDKTPDNKEPQEPIEFVIHHIGQ